MATNPAPNISEIFADEDAALEAAHRLYGSLAQSSIEGFSAAFELNPQQKERLLGALAVSSDFDQRRRIADGLSLLTNLSPEVVVSSADLAVVPEPTDLELSSDINPSRTPEKEWKLLSPQRNWFARLYGEGMAQKIGELEKEQLIEFTIKLTEAYKGLRIARLSEAGKTLRAQQLLEFMNGDSYQVIADRHGVSKESIFQGITKMASSIGKRVSMKELLSLAAEFGLENLSKDQKKWYMGLYQDSEIVDAIEAMGPEQRGYLVAKLGHNLDGLYTRSHGRATTDIRVRQMREFLMDRPIEEIAENLGMNTDAVKDKLRASRESLRTRTDPELLKLLVAQAQSHKPEK